MLRRFLPHAVGALAGVMALLPLSAGAAEALMVSVDHARVLKIARPAETIIVGNPAIVDVTVHDSKTLVLTGRSYGITNLVILDNTGTAILDEKVSVNSFEEGTLRVYRQAQRITYSCSPECAPTVTIGDTDSAFGAAVGQFSARQSMASGSAK